MEGTTDDVALNICSWWARQSHAEGLPEDQATIILSSYVYSESSSQAETLMTNSISSIQIQSSQVFIAIFTSDQTFIDQISPHISPPHVHHVHSDPASSPKGAASSGFTAFVTEYKTPLTPSKFHFVSSFIPTVCEPVTTVGFVRVCNL